MRALKVPSRWHADKQNSIPSFSRPLRQTNHWVGGNNLTRDTPCMGRHLVLHQRAHAVGQLRQTPVEVLAVLFGSLAILTGLALELDWKALSGGRRAERPA